VLQVIGREGSLLQGSVLDPKREPAPRADRPSPPQTDQASRPRFRTAESLLRSARLLESLPRPDASRRHLITELRREAARCLQRGLDGQAAAAIREGAAEAVQD
jgi:hypothetical protein